MPPPYLLTIRDQILYEHALLMSRAAFGKPEHGFVYDRFKLLRTGRLRIEDTIRDWERDHPLPEACIFCGSKETLTTDHLVPTARGGSDSAENRVLTCASCNTTRGEQGVYEWMGLIKKDSLNRIVAARYLRQLYAAHEAAGTLGVSKEEIGTLCHSCPLPGVCEEWAAEGRMTCLCLESVLPRRPAGTTGE
jgi:hypothetical protein